LQQLAVTIKQIQKYWSNRLLRVRAFRRKISIAGLTKALVPRPTWQTIMPPKRSITLTEAELRLMKILWQRGESGVGDLVAAIPADAPLAYNSVLTTIRILEQKGYVTHRQEGRAYLYVPCVAEQDAGRSEVRHMLQRFFGNSREQLLLSLLDDRDITREELARLKEAIAKAAVDTTEGA
jgi:predicted transcriptional regulator